MIKLLLLLITINSVHSIEPNYVQTTEAYEQAVSLELTTDCIDEIDLQYRDSNDQLEISSSDYNAMIQECKNTYEAK